MAFSELDLKFVELMKMLYLQMSTGWLSQRRVKNITSRYLQTKTSTI